MERKSKEKNSETFFCLLLVFFEFFRVFFLAYWIHFSNFFVSTNSFTFLTLFVSEIFFCNTTASSFFFYFYLFFSFFPNFSLLSFCNFVRDSQKNWTKSQILIKSWFVWSTLMKVFSPESTDWCSIINFLSWNYIHIRNLKD